MMKEWFYLTLGFALLFTLYRGERRGSARAVGRSTLELLLAVPILIVIDQLSFTYLWHPVGRGDLRFITIFLWGLVMDRGRERLGKKAQRGEIRLLASPFFLALTAFSLWTIGAGDGHFLWGVGLVLGTGIFEWLLIGLRERMRLSLVPESLQPRPILFWLAALLFLAFWGFQGIHL